MDHSVIGPDGELRLSQAVRDQLGLKPGDRVRLDVDPVHRSLRLSGVGGGARSAADASGSPIDALIGIGGRFSRAVSNDEMTDAVRRRAAERFLRE